MESLGQYLSNLREAAHLSLDDVYQDIKVSTEKLKYIESNQLNSLGEPGVARATVYTYARYLGADEQKAMYLFDQIIPPYKQSKFTPRLPIKETKMLITTNFIWTVAIILIVAILGSILLVSYNKGYLKRPVTKVVKDTVKTADTVQVSTPVKPDTLHDRMLSLTTKPKQAKADSLKQEKRRKPKTSEAYADTTDYIDELIFDRKDSPFNMKP